MNYDVKSLMCPKEGCSKIPWVAQSALYCGCCGSELVPVPTCVCGKEIDMDVVLFRHDCKLNAYCRNCGQHITEPFLSSRTSLADKKWREVKGHV